MSEDRVLSGDRAGALRLVLACLERDAESAEHVLVELAGRDGGLADLALGCAQVAAVALESATGRGPAVAAVLGDLQLNLDRRDR